MKNATFAILIACLSYVMISCEKAPPIPASAQAPTLALNQLNLSAELDNVPLSLGTTDGRTVTAYISKKAGMLHKAVLLLHAGSADLTESQSVSFGFNDATYGGHSFYERDYICLTVEFTEFHPDETKATRGKEELKDTEAAYLFLHDSLAVQGMPMDTIVAFGVSRGGTNALRLGIAHELNAIVTASAAVNWFATHDSIQSGFLQPSPKDSILFYDSVIEWGNPVTQPQWWLAHSVGLRLPEFQSRYFMINGTLDQAVMVHTIDSMRNAYEDCVQQNLCEPGSKTVIHPLGHTDWRTPATMENIFVYIEQGI